MGNVSLDSHGMPKAAKYIRLPPKNLVATTEPDDSVQGVNRPDPQAPQSSADPAPQPPTPQSSLSTSPTVSANANMAGRPQPTTNNNLLKILEFAETQFRPFLTKLISLSASRGITEKTRYEYEGCIWGFLEHIKLTWRPNTESDIQLAQKTIKQWFVTKDRELEQIRQQQWLVQQREAAAHWERVRQQQQAEQQIAKQREENALLRKMKAEDEQRDREAELAKYRTLPQEAKTAIGKLMNNTNQFIAFDKKRCEIHEASKLYTIFQDCLPDSPSLHKGYNKHQWIISAFSGNSVPNLQYDYGAKAGTCGPDYKRFKTYNALRNLLNASVGFLSP